MSNGIGARGALALVCLTAACGVPHEADSVTGERGTANQQPSATATLQEGGGDTRVSLERLRAQFALRAPERLPRGLHAEASSNPWLASEGAVPLEHEGDRFIPRYDQTEAALEDVEVSLPARADGAFHVRRTDTQLGVSVRLLGADALPGEAAGGFVGYVGAGPNRGTLLQKVTAFGTEDFLTLDAPIEGDEVVYEIELSEQVAGLRLVANTLELLDADGTPSLRVPPPYLVTSTGEQVRASLDVSGCSVDRNSAPPWGRPTTAPGSHSCLVHVSWASEEVTYPALLDPSWTSTGTMVENRSYHTATLLQDGRVLVAGGWSVPGYVVHASAELYDPATHTWAATGSMPSAQLQGAAALRSDGSVVFVGGWNASLAESAKAASYNPLLGSWTALPSMPAARGKPYLTLLSGDTLFVAGGSNGSGPLATAALYNPLLNTWRAANGSMTQVLADPVGVAIAGNRLLLVGAAGTGSLAQIYNIATETWTPAAAPLGNHAGDTITLLPTAQNKVLIAGGSVQPSIAQVYDPTTNLWTNTGATSQVRAGATATRLANGRVLIAGSTNAQVAHTAELYDPQWGTWAPLPNLNAPRLGMHTATLLANGHVLVAGGTSAAFARSAEELDLSPTPTSAAEYRFPASVDPDVLADRAIELWAVVHRPATLAANTRYPVLLFLHGQYQTCRSIANPHLRTGYQYSIDGTCEAGAEVLPNHRGYDYIAEELASRGYIVVSINSNRGLNLDPGITGDINLIAARGRLILRHLDLLSRWDRGVVTTPASIGADLTGKLDLSQVGLMGHSRGGEAARAAYELYREAGSLWPGQIVTPVAFRGIFEVGTTDQSERTWNVSDVPWVALHPRCDGDAPPQGIQVFDRTLASIESVPSFKATYTVWGANHNFYNTQWQTTDVIGCGNHREIYPPGLPNAKRTGSAEQRQTGLYSALSFFLANVGSTRDTRFNAVFDTRFAPVANARIDRGYSPGAHPSYARELEDFANEAGTSSASIPNVHSNVTVTHGTPDWHSARAATIDWTSASTNTYFQSNWASPGAGNNLSTYQFLDFRIDRATSALNPSAPTTLSVQLVHASGALSTTAVPVQNYVSLVGPAQGYDYLSSDLQTARIPLSAFGSTPLTAVRGVRFTFSGTTSGSLYLANIRATRTAADAATVGLHGSGAPAPTFHTLNPSP
jgi:N-acetylneuraminic acid mutarotase